MQIWIHNPKITLWKNFGQFFRFHEFWSSCEKKHFSILAVFQNVWDLHKFGLQIWIQNAKITLWKNFGQFFRFHRFWSSGPGMQKKGHFPVLAVFQNIWDLHKFGLQIWIQNTKIISCNFFDFIDFCHPYERISGNFFDFIEFGHQVRVCKKR